MNKLKFRGELKCLSLYDFEEPLDKLIELLCSFRDEYKSKGYTNLTMESDCDYNGDYSFRLFGIIEETDKEYEIRKKEEAERDKRDKERECERERVKEKADRNLYLKLKAKFEGKNAPKN